MTGARFRQKQDHINQGRAGVSEDSEERTCRGHAVVDLVAGCRFEAVAHLIWFGALPDADQGRRFMAQERARRQLGRGLLARLRRLPDSCSPIEGVATAISALGAAAGDDPRAHAELALSMLARLPAVVAFDHRRRRGLGRLPSDPALGLVENFLWMCFGVRPPAAIARCLERALILSAGAERPPSRPDHAGLAAALAALARGPADGGAEAVMRMMLEIGDPARAADWLRAALAAGRPLPGFSPDIGAAGGEDRLFPLKRALREVAALRQDQRWLELAEALERTMRDETGRLPTPALFAAPAGYLIGFDLPLLASIEVIGRIPASTAPLVAQWHADAAPVLSVSGRCPARDGALSTMARWGD